MLEVGWKVPLLIWRKSIVAYEHTRHLANILWNNKNAIAMCQGLYDYM